jgi:hypothetical protein
VNVEDEIMDERQRAGWTFWTCVALTLPLFYLTALGPLCWVTSRTGGEGVVNRLYSPLMAAANGLTNPSALRVLLRYSTFGSEEGWDWDFGFPENDYVGNWEWTSNPRPSF